MNDYNSGPGENTPALSSEEIRELVRSGECSVSPAAEVNVSIDDVYARSFGASAEYPGVHPSDLRHIPSVTLQPPHGREIVVDPIDLLPDSARVLYGFMAGHILLSRTAIQRL